MLLRLSVIGIAAIGLIACSPEKDATSSAPLPTLSYPLGPSSSLAAAPERPATQPKEDGEKRSD